MTFLIIPQKKKNLKKKSKGIDWTLLEWYAFKNFFYLNNRKFGHVLLLFCFRAVAHSSSSMGMEIWHVDQLLLFQKVSSMLFGAVNDILLSVPDFSVLFASRGTWDDALPFPPAGGWAGAQYRV